MKMKINPRDNTKLLINTKEVYMNYQVSILTDKKDKSWKKNEENIKKILTDKIKRYKRV